MPALLLRSPLTFRSSLRTYRPKCWVKLSYHSIIVIIQRVSFIETFEASEDMTTAKIEIRFVCIHLTVSTYHFISEIILTIVASTQGEIRSNLCFHPCLCQIFGISTRHPLLWYQVQARQAALVAHFRKVCQNYPYLVLQTCLGFLRIFRQACGGLLLPFALALEPSLLLGWIRSRSADKMLSSYFRTLGLEMACIVQNAIAVCLPARTSPWNDLGSVYFPLTHTSRI